ncbi:Hypothetical protein A7982_00605 [Minicystis rosea]|nr:Hypothetical protein A7982_00605 [Minicystis rosea]
METTPTGSGGSGGSGTTASSTSTTTATSASSSASSSTGGTATCESLAEAIAAVMQGTEACTAVVRLDYGSHSVLGFDVKCAPYAASNEEKARATAQADTGQGQAGQSIAGAQPEDEWVFWQGAGDFGGSAAVSRRNGTSVFGGTTVWSGKGEITYPKAWKPVSAIGLGCGQTGQEPPQARGFDLGTGQKLAESDVTAALAVVWNTAVPAGLRQKGYVFDAMVLLYPRTVGAFDPTTAEWIVLVNSGWLE